MPKPSSKSPTDSRAAKPARRETAVQLSDRVIREKARRERERTRLALALRAAAERAMRLDPRDDRERPLSKDKVFRILRDALTEHASIDLGRQTGIKQGSDTSKK